MDKVQNIIFLAKYRDHEYKPGDHIVITAGDFKGIHGREKERRGIISDRKHPSPKISPTIKW